jgi:23S rRNA pseudouridine2605 synthase
MTPERGTVPLARALSKLGIASRSEAVSLIRAGRVSVDGRVARSPAAPVVPERIDVRIDGRRMRRATSVTVMLHKPRGVVTTRRDPQGRPTVLHLVADVPARVFPVGRLDLATAGLLLLTNDSKFAAWVTDPANQVPRTYAVTVRGEVQEAERQRLEAGLTSAGEWLKAARVVVRKRSHRETHLVVELTEGRNREIRRLFAATGHEVTRLKRVGFGGLTLGDLQPGAWRLLTDAELSAAFPGAALSCLRNSSLTSTKTVV